MAVELVEETEITEEEREKIGKDFKELIRAFEKEHMRVKKEVTEAPKIVYCMAIYEERMAQVLNCLNRVRPYVDRCVIVVDDSVTPENVALLAQWSCRPHYRKWDNHFSKQRNEYLAHVNEGEWVLVSDPDELHSQSLMDDLKTVVTEAEKRNINILGINAHDITTELDGTVTENVSNWHKQLLFRFEEGVRYVGVVHETLLPGVHGWRAADLDKRYYYEHIKSMVEIKERGARNVFCGGGGNNVEDKNPMYVELHEWANRYSLKNWPLVRDFIRSYEQGIPSVWEELKAIIVRHRNDSGWDWENESRDFFLWCKALFPQEFKEWESTPKPPSKGKPPEVMAYVEDCYKNTLGRHADTAGKEIYTKAILNGKIKREDLPKILKESPEYKMKLSRAKEPITVGAIVLAKNEEKRIQKCLEHLRPHVDFLAVFADSSTTDRTIEIAKEIADVVMVRPFCGSFADERNRAQAMMPTTWVLHVDADETFSPDFLKDMKKIIAVYNVDGFRFPRVNPGKRDWPDYQVRLLRTSTAVWKGKHCEVPWHKQKNKPVDQVSVRTLDQYPVVHSGAPRDWGKILGC